MKKQNDNWRKYENWLKNNAYISKTRKILAYISKTKRGIQENENKNESIIRYKIVFLLIF